MKKTWCRHIKWWADIAESEMWRIKILGQWWGVPRSWDICPVHGCKAKRPTRTNKRIHFRKYDANY